MSRLEELRETRSGLKALGPSRQPMVAAVDLGTSKVACFILRPEGVNRAVRTLQTAGVGYVQSRGVRAGVITDTELAIESIAQAVERAETLAGVQVSGVTVSTAGGDLGSQRVVSQVSIGARPVCEADCARAVTAAIAKLRAPGRRPIHFLPISWTVDGHKGVRDPRGMAGRDLKLDLLVVTMEETAFSTLCYCVERAHLRFEGAVAAPLASALSALEEDEMDLGCVCIDMGGGSTSMAVFANGSLAHLDSIPVGGGHVTQDIAKGLSTTIAGAERIKTLHGSAIASNGEDREMIEAPPRGDDPGAGPVVAPRSMLKGVIAPRVEETFELLRDRLKACGVPIEPGAGIVLTGGASQLAGVRETAVRVFDRPVRLGRPRRTPHLADAAAGPAYCAAAGVLQRAAFGPREAVSSRSLIDGKPRPPDPYEGAGPLTRAMGWLKENLEKA